MREYLYVDPIAVRGALAQLDSGITESETETKHHSKRTGGGLKGFAEHEQDWGTESVLTKSMGDALFPTLEDALDADELIRDISLEASDDDWWMPESLNARITPGEIVRITASGSLVDSRYFAQLMASFATTHRGLAHLEALPNAKPTTPPKRKGQQTASSKSSYSPLPHEDSSLESSIPLGQMRMTEDETDPLKGETLRGMVQVMRGMFQPGLHLLLSPSPSQNGSISVRLKEGSEYLESDPEILFAHYGVAPQRWSVVGTVRHLAQKAADMASPSFMDEDNVHRAKFAQYANGMATVLGEVGFTGLPQRPGFSVVPWGVYRNLGTRPR